MEVVSVSCRELFDTPNGKYVEIACRGHLPVGSEGNSSAAQMLDEMWESLARFQVAGVLFDFSELSYRWGDYMGRIAYVLMDKENWRFRPSSIVAQGETAKALESLLGSTGLDIGTRVFENRQEALEFLRTNPGRSCR